LLETNENMPRLGIATLEALDIKNHCRCAHQDYAGYME
jgi:hypothetical protein